MGEWIDLVEQKFVTRPFGRDRLLLRDPIGQQIDLLFKSARSPAR